MSVDPFKPSRCTCSTTASMHAAINGSTHLCPQHDAGQIANRDLSERDAAERADAESRYNAADERYRSLKALVDPEAPCTCLPVAEALKAHLSGNPPEPCAVHDTPAGPAPIALNNDAALAAVIGLPLARSSHNPEPPTAA